MDKKIVLVCINEYVETQVNLGYNFANKTIYFLLRFWILRVNNEICIHHFWVTVGKKNIYAGKWQLWESINSTKKLKKCVSHLSLQNNKEIQKVTLIHAFKSLSGVLFKTKK